MAASLGGSNVTLKFLCSAVASWAGGIGAPSKTWSRIMREWTEPVSKSAAAFANSCSASRKSRSVNVGVTVAGRPNDAYDFAET